MPHWNDSNDKSVFICDENFDMADFTKKSVY